MRGCLNLCTAFIVFCGGLVMSCGRPQENVKSTAPTVKPQHIEDEGELPPSAGFTLEQRKKLFTIIDMHSHLDYSASKRILTVLKNNGISAIVNMSGGNFDSDISENYVFQLDNPGVIYNFYTPNWRTINQPGFGEQEADLFEKAVKSLGYKGLKISKAPGLFLRDKKGKIIPVDDPRFDPLWKKAGELGVPVLIHTSDPEAFWLPPDEKNERWDELKVHPGWSFYGKDVPPRNELLKQRNNVIKKHSNTVFICTHFGNNAEHPDLVAKLLDEYPNMYIDVAARIPEFGRHPAPVMRKFFLKYQDRILFGTDIGIGKQFLMLGSGDGTVPPLSAADTYYKRTFQYFESDLKEMESPTPIQGRWKVHPIHLPVKVLKKLYYENAKQVILYNEIGI